MLSAELSIFDSDSFFWCGVEFSQLLHQFLSRDCKLRVLPGSITPIFTLSNVSGESLDLLKVFLNIIPPLSNTKEQEELMEQLTEFQVRRNDANICRRRIQTTRP